MSKTLVHVRPHVASYTEQGLAENDEFADHFHCVRTVLETRHTKFHINNIYESCYTLNSSYPRQSAPYCVSQEEAA